MAELAFVWFIGALIISLVAAVGALSYSLTGRPRGTFIFLGKGLLAVALWPIVLPVLAVRAVVRDEW